MFQTVLDWEATKNWLSSTLHLTHHQLHIIVGLVAYFIFARLLRRPLGSLVPLIPIAILETINELFDFTRYMVSGWPWTPNATLYDILLTLGPPLIVALLLRVIRRRPISVAR